jgi:hypothetical protein
MRSVSLAWWLVFCRFPVPTPTSGTSLLWAGWLHWDSECCFRPSCINDWSQQRQQSAIPRHRKVDPQRCSMQFSSNDRWLFPLGLALIGLFSAGILGLLSVIHWQHRSTPQRSGLVVQALESKPAQYLGARSYSLYLWHFPIAHLFMSQARPVRTLAWFVLSVAAAEVSYRFVERPLRRSTSQKREGAIQ